MFLYLYNSFIFLNYFYYSRFFFKFLKYLFGIVLFIISIHLFKNCFIFVQNIPLCRHSFRISLSIFVALEIEIKLLFNILHYQKKKINHNKNLKAFQIAASCSLRLHCNVFFLVSFLMQIVLSSLSQYYYEIFFLYFLLSSYISFPAQF